APPAARWSTQREAARVDARPERGGAAGHDTVPFGPLLRRYRLAASLSQAALADRAGLSTDAITALERGRRTSPRLETVALLADALQLDPADRAALIAAATRTPAADNPTSSLALAQPAPPARASPLALPPTALIGR